MSTDAPSITCPRCGAVSSHPTDIAERYCGRCHAFHETMPHRFDPDHNGECFVCDEGADAPLHARHAPMCGRCYDEVPTFPATCAEHPESIPKGAALGMYHCPDCGAMVLAGLPHPDLCQRCLDRTHPAFD